MQVPAGEWLAVSTVMVQQIHRSAYIASRFTSRCICVNDYDECGIALIQQFNSATKDKIQKQYLLQVEENRNPYTLRSAICMNFALCRE